MSSQRVWSRTNASRRGLALAALALVAAALLVACGSDSDSDSDSSEGAGKETLGLVALVSTQKAGDKGPVDDMRAALDRLKDELGVETRFIEATDPSTYETTLTSLGKAKAAVVITTFNEMSKPIAAVAPNYPDTKFVHIFGDPQKPKLDNVSSIAYDYYEGCYLAGVFAATLTGEREFGYVGGANVPPLVADFNGFMEGAREVTAAANIKPAFTNSFEDPAKGQDVAAALYADGATAIMTDAAASDIGVLNAAKRKDGLVIAGGESFLKLGKGYIPAVVVLRFGKSLEDQVKAIADGQFKAGHSTSGLHDGIVDLLPSTTFADDGVRDADRFDEAVKAVDEVRKRILAGELDVPLNTKLR